MDGVDTWFGATNLGEDRRAVRLAPLLDSSIVLFVHLNVIISTRLIG